MALEVYYPQDILNALLAAEQSCSAAMLAASNDSVFAQGFMAGYRAALLTIALAFGLTRPNNVQGDDSETLLALLLLSHA